MDVRRYTYEGAPLLAVARIYQGQTTFTPNARPWFVRSNDMFRVLQMLTNNRQRVDNIVPN